VKKTRFTEAQTVGILKELDAGVRAAELARKHGIHANTIRLWRDKYGGMETSDLAKLCTMMRWSNCARRFAAKPLLKDYELTRASGCEGDGPSRRSLVHDRLGARAASRTQ
jgi:putative transposase